MSKGNKEWIWGAAIGAIVGSVTALLLAPKPGKELRKDIADGARQVGEKTGEIASKVSEQGVHLAGIVKETAGSLIQDIQAWREGKSEEGGENEGKGENESKEVQISAIAAGNETADTEAPVAAAVEQAVPEGDSEDKIQS
ncbi:YtxH domain-containing protein [Paenibacillus ihumii]|uniref:YtxH domain-containing protein n=1 Tax=Paenibacillus ihumii TaxID=687436 RepID=UPI0006D7E979|nr:YtxH domain-containing protein [Paenibacillus ihumii]